MDMTVALPFFKTLLLPKVVDHVPSTLLVIDQTEKEQHLIGLFSTNGLITYGYKSLLCAQF
jgi:hypothetical protein